MDMQPLSKPAEPTEMRKEANGVGDLEILLAVEARHESRFDNSLQLCEE